jgi:hypothetical protein
MTVEPVVSLSVTFEGSIYVSTHGLSDSNEGVLGVPITVQFWIGLTLVNIAYVRFEFTIVEIGVPCTVEFSIAVLVTVVSVTSLSKLRG